MNKVLIGCILYFSFHLSAQNLIPNPGFEEVIDCPEAGINLQYTKYWQRIEQHYGSPDQFYGDCDYFGIDNPMAPGQRPFDGKGYVGAFCYGDQLREYFMVELTSPMVKDSVYEISFYVLPAVSYGTAINSFGVHFSRNPVKGDDERSLAVLPLEEHIGNPEGRILSDTVNWSLISGFYTAKGGERYATFGNFRSDDQTKSELFSVHSIRPDRSYLLMDGVQVKKENSGVDTLTVLDAEASKEDRILKVNGEFNMPSGTLKIAIWDHMEYDRDSILLILNDSILLGNQRLRRFRKKLKIKLSPGEYLLKMVALNLGEIPPNTAAIELSDGVRTKRYVLTSDLESTEYIRIYVE